MPPRIPPRMMTGVRIGPITRTEAYLISSLERGDFLSSLCLREFALIFELPLYLTSARGLSVLQSGFVLAAMAIGAFLARAQARHIAARIGPVGVVALGLGSEVVGIAVMALLLAPSVSVWVETILLVVYGLGLGLASVQLTSLVLADIPADQSGQGSATQRTVKAHRQGGS